MEIDNKYQSIILEALEEMMYRISLDLASYKGGPLTKERRALTRKQAKLEKLQHLIFSQKKL